MKTITPYRTAVTSFSSPSPAAAAAEAPHRQRQERGFEYDSGDYVLSVCASPPPPPPSHRDASATSSSSSGGGRVVVVAAALSDRSVVFYDAASGRIGRRIENAHDGPISEVHFLPREYLGYGRDAAGTIPPLISASRDGTIKLWDVGPGTATTTFGGDGDRPAATMRLALPDEEALSVSTGFGGTLVAVGTSRARISFFDLRRAEGGPPPSGAPMGSYVDAHTEEVTRVKFRTVPSSPQSPSEGKTILASASEDGLVAIHDPSRPSEEAALLSVLNVGAPLRDVGFFGPNSEGLYALTGCETMDVHHWDSAQRVSDVGGAGLRSLLSNAVDGADSSERGAGGGDSTTEEGSAAVEYLVGCAWADVASTGSPALHLLAGNSRGDGYLFRMDADRITPVAHLRGGHRGCIRDFCWIDDDSGGPGGNSRRLVTGGEDARLCEWDLTGGGGDAGGGLGANGRRTPGNRSGGGGPTSGRHAARAKKGGGDGKGKKKLGSPY